MAKYKLKHQELIEQWNSHLHFINSSSKKFDEGLEIEARRIATSLRVIFHDTKTSHPLIKQTGFKNNFPLWSSSLLYTPSNLVSSWTLLMLESNETGLFFRPINIPRSRTFLLKYDDWWNEIIFDDKKNVFTRKDIVCYVANQDGGAHVDSVLDEKYAELTKLNSLGWLDSSGNSAKNNPAYNAIRQIALELIVSQNIFNKGSYTRKKQKDRFFEMRFYDQTRRFKWSSTELPYSDETLNIIKNFKKEDRILYLQEYSDGAKYEYIG
ncbi:hypothetical protein ABEV04_11555 [Heyndrickxia faecalis]|uniref:hypothetical protein n=1 Tax=Heyndrickxia TaxID=2837504 RepID=UPI00077901C5|nr:MULTISPECIES: hypothetical protein [Heyndrickxia]KYC62684.1 hypothetical protein B4100_0895 [Heyndrickxia coagulans]MED4313348.1 hypothetical protein [Heyndrickxia coagulans]MED4976433.1 hypothetical protein [Weizmannia sp. CD-2023]UZH05008.1 hypothetical protein ONG97_08425 [Heyndrickxia coagulans]